VVSLTGTNWHGPRTPPPGYGSPAFGYGSPAYGYGSPAVQVIGYGSPANLPLIEVVPGSAAGNGSPACDTHWGDSRQRTHGLRFAGPPQATVRRSEIVTLSPEPIMCLTGDSLDWGLGCGAPTYNSTPRWGIGYGSPASCYPSGCSWATVRRSLMSIGSGGYGGWWSTGDRPLPGSACGGIGGERVGPGTYISLGSPELMPS